MSWVAYGVHILVFVGLSFSGCRSLDYRVKDMPQEQNIKYILTYFQHLKTISNEELNQELKNTEQDYLENDNEINALKFSLVLIYSGLTGRDEYKFTDILGNIVDYSSDGSLKNLASLLEYILLESQKKERLYKLTSKQLNDAIEKKREQEVVQETITEKLNSILNERKKQELRYRQTLKKLTEQKQMVEKLQKKIEELKEIERSINERKNTKAPTT